MKTSFDGLSLKWMEVHRSFVHDLESRKTVICSAWPIISVNRSNRKIVKKLSGGYKSKFEKACDRDSRATTQSNNYSLSCSDGKFHRARIWSFTLNLISFTCQLYYIRCIDYQIRFLQTIIESMKQHSTGTVMSWVMGRSCSPLFRKRYF